MISIYKAIYKLNIAVFQKVYVSKSSIIRMRSNSYARRDQIKSEAFKLVD